MIALPQTHLRVKRTFGQIAAGEEWCPQKPVSRRRPENSQRVGG